MENGADNVHKLPEATTASNEPKQVSDATGPRVLRSILRHTKPNEDPEQRRTPRHSIKWVDDLGMELAIIHQYEPSEADFSEDEEETRKESGGCCTVS